MADIKFAFIGMGLAGSALGAHLAGRGLRVAGFYDVKPGAGRGFKRFDSVQDLAAAADIIFITVPDGKIAQAAKNLKKYPLKNKIICHASGALPAQILDVKNACAAHPLCALPRPRTKLDGVTFALEGPAAGTMAKIFKKTENPTVKISAKDKPLYHAACVIAGNLNFALLQTAADLFKKTKIPPAAWRGCFDASCSNFFDKGLKALTGPLKRGDAQTIKTHLKALRGPAKDIYKTLSKVLSQNIKESK